MSISPQNSRRGFTLVELLVVIAIIGILVGLLLPAVQSAREAARRATCQNNIRQVVLATANYESAFQRFPAGANSTIFQAGTTSAVVGGSLFVSILPYMDQEPLSDDIKLEVDNIIAGGAGFPLYGGAIDEQPQPLLICPSASQSDAGVDTGDGGEFSSHYVGISGPASAGARVFGSADPIGCDGVFSPFSNDRFVLTGSSTAYDSSGGNNPGMKFRGFKNKNAVSFTDIGDGSSNTFAFAEFSGGENRVDPNNSFLPLRGAWTIGAGGFFGARDFFVPELTYQTKTILHRINSKTANHYNNFTNAAPLNSAHSGGINIARADSSVAFVEDSIPVDILQFLCGVDDGEVVNDF